MLLSNVNSARKPLIFWLPAQIFTQATPFSLMTSITVKCQRAGAAGIAAHPFSGTRECFSITYHAFRQWLDFALNFIILFLFFSRMARLTEVSLGG